MLTGAASTNSYYNYNDVILSVVSTGVAHKAKATCHYNDVFMSVVSVVVLSKAKATCIITMTSSCLLCQ